MSAYFLAIGGRLTTALEHTCDGSPCSLGVTFDRVVRLKTPGEVRLEGVRHDGTPIHHYDRAANLPKGAR